MDKKARPMVFNRFTRSVALGLSMAFCAGPTGVAAAVDSPTDGGHAANVLVANSGSTHPWHKRTRSKKGLVRPHSKKSPHSKKNALYHKKSSQHGKQDAWHSKTRPKKWPHGTPDGSQTGTI
jgi:hypothetical protein